MAHTVCEVNQTGASLGGPSESNSETSLSTSSTNRLKRAFPLGPQHHEATGPSGPGGKTLDRANYRSYYVEEVLGGNNNNYKAKSLNGTEHSRNYSVNGPPDLNSPLTPADEETAGAAGSTIVASMLGPNVNVGPAMAAVGWQVNQAGSDLEPGTNVVDPSSTASPLPFVGDGSASPSDTSVNLSNSELHVQPPGVSTNET